MSTHFVQEDDHDVLAQLQEIRAGGVNWVRDDFPWAQVEPRPGTFNWEVTDRLMEAASKTNVKVLAIIDYSAPWASSDPSGRGDVMYPPRHAEDFADYAAKVAERYGEGGQFWSNHPELTPAPLAAMELWNEPYGNWFWKPDPDPARYAELVEAAAPAVRAVDPSITLLASGDLGLWRHDDSGGPWLAALLRADPHLPALIDGWSVHPYPSPFNLGPFDQAWKPEFNVDRVELIENVLESADADLPIWITEIGWTTARDFEGHVSEHEQALYLTQTVKRAVTEWDGFVKRTFVFSWDRSNNDPDDRDTNNGIRNPDGSPREAWTALQRLLTDHD